MNAEWRVTQTVILAAGSGSRLSSSRGDVPKPLVSVGGRPLIAHALEHAHVCGCDSAVIVVGFEATRVRAEIEAMALPLRSTFVSTADFTAPNGVSLLAAEPVASPVFFLQMVDHLFASPSLHHLTQVPLASDESGRVLVDSAPSEGVDLADATKVQLAGSRVIAIGKGLTGWDAVDAGCFVLTHSVFNALREVPTDRDRTVSSGMRVLASRGALGAVDLRGAVWVDLDTPADYQVAEQMLAGTHTQPRLPGVLTAQGCNE